MLYELKQSYLVAGAAGDGMVRRPFTIGGRPSPHTRFGDIASDVVGSSPAVLAS